MNEQELAKARDDLQAAREALRDSEGHFRDLLEVTFDLFKWVTAGNAGGTVACLGIIGTVLARSPDGRFPADLLIALRLFLYALGFSLLAHTFRALVIGEYAVWKLRATRDVKGVSESGGRMSIKNQRRFLLAFFVLGAVSALLLIIGIAFALSFLKSRAI